MTNAFFFFPTAAGKCPKCPGKHVYLSDNKIDMEITKCIAREGNS